MSQFQNQVVFHGKCCPRQNTIAVIPVKLVLDLIGERESRSIALQNILKTLDSCWSLSRTPIRGRNDNLRNNNLLVLILILHMLSKKSCFGQMCNEFISKSTLTEQFLSLRLLSASGGWIRNLYSRKILEASLRVESLRPDKPAYRTGRSAGFFTASPGLFSTCI